MNRQPDERIYAMEMKPNEGDAITREYLTECVRSALTDDVPFGPRFTLRLIFVQNITMEELTRDAKHLKYPGSNSGYRWYSATPLMGDKHPELHVVLHQQ